MHMILYSSRYDLNQVARLPYAGTMAMDLMEPNVTLAFVAFSLYDDRHVPMVHTAGFQFLNRVYDFNHKGPFHGSVILCCNTIK